MRLLFRLILLLIVLSPVGLAALAWYSLAEQPRVIQGSKLTHQDIARAKGIVQRNDPRKLPAGTRRALHLGQHDINLAANYLVQRFGATAAVMIEPDVAFIDISGRIPHLPVRPYLNLSAEIHEIDGQPLLHDLRLGQLAIPDALAELLLGQVVQRLGQSRGASLAMTSVQDFKLRRGQLDLVYEWQPELLEAVQQELIPAGQQHAMSAYYQRLAEWHTAGKGSRGSLSTLLPEMFELAARRSHANDPVMENRALLAVLGAWASRHGMDRLLPADQRQGRLARFRLKLQRRTDFGQHFLTSAALAANGDTRLSDAVGLYKEVSDSQGGSGFSFTDIAADRAGTRFGELAVASTAQARALQKRIAAGVGETDIMPAARDLPEHMSAAEFERRYGGVDSPPYRRMMKQIEQRIARLPLYRQP